ncbi:hypothetical protein [Foetidibacter luteolus]|nr:hypothetical protein [Foetidibacter luteolus]
MKLNWFIFNADYQKQGGCKKLRCVTTAPGIEADTPLKALCRGFVAE